MSEDRILLDPQDEIGMPWLELDKETAKQLNELLSNQFINYEKYPNIISLVRTLREHFNDEDK